MHLSISFTLKVKKSIASTQRVVSEQPITVRPGIKIGKLVRANMSKIIAFCNAYDNELSNLKSKTYSKETFNLNFPFLKRVMPDSSKQDRYWEAKYIINNEHYFVTSEWYKGSIPFFKSYLSKITKENKS